jgi:hypothetical protein
MPIGRGKALQERLPVALQKVFDSSTASEFHVDIPSSRKEERVQFLVEKRANAY